MTQFLPDNLLALFAARPPLPYLPPVDELTVNKKRPPITGLSQYLKEFETEQKPPPEKPHIETREERRIRRRKEKEELLAYKLEQNIAVWDPADNENATSDPYRTLFVARLNYETTESRLRREFEQYGKITKIIMPHDREGKPRGYAFIEYSHKSEMSAVFPGNYSHGKVTVDCWMIMRIKNSRKFTVCLNEVFKKFMVRGKVFSAAYKKADGVKIDGRRLIVDYERGRTNKSWLPRRLGGGKGDTRKAREPRSSYSREPDDYPSSSRSRDYREDRSRDRDRYDDKYRRRSRERDERYDRKDRYDDRRDRRDDRRRDRY